MARRTRSARRTRADQGVPGEVGRAPVVDGYSDLDVIGRGASATVYRANQEGYDRHVAIKVLNVDMSDRRARRRFDRERSVNGRLSHHPNVVTVLESGLIDGRQPYLAMELYEKGSLADRLVEQGPFGVDVVLHHMIRVAGALESAHRLGVLHRDIKPHNILLSNYGEPALADFGIASILDNEPSMTAALTVTHAPPELLEGEQPTPQSDVYALGSTMYTLLAGSTPFAGSEADGVLAQLMRITTGEVPRIARDDVSAELHDLMCAAMARQAADRPMTALEFGIALQRHQAALGLARTEMPIEVGTDAADGPTVSRPIAGPPTAGQPIASQPIAEPPAVGPSADFESPPDHAQNHSAPVSSTAPSAPEHSPDELTIDVAPGRPAARSIPLPSVSDRTVVGRQAKVRRPAVEPERRRRTTVLASIAAVVLGAGGAYGAWSLLAQDDGPLALAPTAVPDSTVPAVDLSGFAPTDVQLLRNGETTVVTWTDPTANPESSFVVRYRLRDDDPTDETSWRVAGSAERGKLSLDFEPGGELACVVVITGVLVDGSLVPVESVPACVA